MSAPFGHDIVPPSIDIPAKKAFILYPLMAQRLALLNGYSEKSTSQGSRPISIRLPMLYRGQSGWSDSADVP